MEICGRRKKKSFKLFDFNFLEQPRMGCGENKYWDKESCSCKCVTAKSCIDNDYLYFSCKALNLV